MAENISIVKCLNESEPAESFESPIITNIAMGMVALLSVCGIIGNALVIFVFSRQKQKLSSTIFILTLAVTDFLTSLITMPYTVGIELYHYKMEYDAICKLYQFMKTTTIPFSAFVMVAIALDRYLCIVYPFKHVMTINRAKVTVFLLSILALILGVICSLMTGTWYIYISEIPQCNNSNGNNTSHLPTISDTLIYNVSNSKEGMHSTYTVWHNQSYIGVNSTHSVTTDPIPGELISNGYCRVSTLIFGKEFGEAYQKIYSSFFGVCAVLVIILYALTYRSVLTQRRKRFHLSNSCCGFLTRNISGDSGSEHNEFTILNTREKDKNLTVKNGNKASVKIKDGKASLQEHDKSFRNRTDTGDSTETMDVGNGNASSTDSKQAQENYKQDKQDSNIRQNGVSRAKLKKLRVANIKTALMLSIVAFIYIVAFTPACLMALKIIPMNAIVYYLYFTYNVANPVIYAFLNQNFRTHLQTIFNCAK